MNLRPPALIALVSVALLGSLVLGTTGQPRQDARTAVAIGAVPEAGGSVCVGGGGETQRGVDIILAAPPMDEVDPASTQRGRGILLAVEDGVQRTAVGPYAPGSIDLVRVDVGPDAWLWTGWADHPLFAWREWRSPGGPGEPRGSVVSRCISADAPEWVVLGLRTDGGNEALIDIANPYVVDATFAITLLTENETFAPIALRNVSVAAGTRVSVRLNDHLPEEPEVTALVTVGAGRLAVEGRLRATAGVGGVEGLATVPALTAPAVTWTFPWIVTGPEVDGAVWILNPEPRTVVVELVVHTQQGVALPEFLESVEVPPGGLVRVDAADLAPAGRRVFGLTLRSSTTGVFAAAGARFLAEDPARTGLVQFVPSSAPDRAWLDAGAHRAAQETVLHIVNLAEVAVEPRIVLTSASAAAGSEIRTLEPGPLAAGAVARVVLPLIGALEERGTWSAVVTGGDGLVVARTTTGADLLEPVAIAALPSQAWRSPAVGLTGRPMDGWVARLGTSGDLLRAPRTTLVPAGSTAGRVPPVG